MGVKAIVLPLAIALLMVGCGEQVVEYTKLQDRDGLKYLPNEETPFTGRAEAFYDDGQKAQELNHKDGKVVSAVAWKPNGEKCPVTNVKDGNGVLVSYSNGKVRMTWLRSSTYKDDK